MVLTYGINQGGDTKEGGVMSVEVGLFSLNGELKIETSTKVRIAKDYVGGSKRTRLRIDPFSSLRRYI